MTTGNEMNRAGPIVDRLNDAIRDNPLAAGLIGAGVAWIVFGGVKGFGTMAGMAKSATGNVASAAVRAGSAAASSASKASVGGSAAIKGAASAVVDSVASIVPNISGPDTSKAADAISQLTSAAGEQFHSAASAGREYGAAIQSRLSESLEKQPLLLGALGLAIGAGIASTFASTATENEWMGEKGAATLATLQTAAGEAKDRALQVVSDIQEEAGRQGLTVDAARDAATTVAEKVKVVAGSARESVTQTIKSKS